jgi:hypothetical protein
MNFFERSLKFLKRRFGQVAPSKKNETAAPARGAPVANGVQELISGANEASANREKLPTSTPVSMSFEKDDLPFKYEDVTQLDRERIKALNVMVDWKTPNATRWAIDRNSGDFLAHIAPDHEPPHWVLFAFYCKGKVHRVELDSTMTNRANGYCVAIAGYASTSTGGEKMADAEKPEFFQRLLQAVTAHVLGEAEDAFSLHRRGKQQPPLSVGGPPTQVNVTVLSPTQSPAATFQIDFPKDY